jgi:hypothetical protein
VKTYAGSADRRGIGSYNLFCYKYNYLFEFFYNSNLTTIPKLTSSCVDPSSCKIQGVPGGKVNILGRHSIDHSKQKYPYVHVSYSERFPR